MSSVQHSEETCPDLGDCPVVNIEDLRGQRAGAIADFATELYARRDVSAAEGLAHLSDDGWKLLARRAGKRCSTQTRALVMDILRGREN